MLQLLLAARKRLRLTQLEMAEKLGISRNYLALIETGRRRVPPQVADQIVTMQQADVTVVDSLRDTSNSYQKSQTVESMAARIAELESELAQARDIIHNQSIALAQGRSPAARPPHIPNADNAGSGGKKQPA